LQDEKLISAVRDGDAYTMNEIINKYARLLWSAVAPVLKSMGTDQDVEECVADVFVFLWQHPEKFDPARGPLKSYLAMLARTYAVNRWRELVRRDTAALDEDLMTDALGLDEEFIRSEDKKDLAAAVESLSEPDREILLRRYYYDQKPREIAAAVGMPVKLIENRLYRTKLKLREMLK